MLYNMLRFFVKRMSVKEDRTLDQYFGVEDYLEGHAPFFEGPLCAGERPKPFLRYFV